MQLFSCRNVHVQFYTSDKTNIQVLKDLQMLMYYCRFAWDSGQKHEHCALCCSRADRCWVFVIWLSVAQQHPDKWIHAACPALWHSWGAPSCCVLVFDVKAYMWGSQMFFFKKTVPVSQEPLFQVKALHHFHPLFTSSWEQHLPEFNLAFLVSVSFLHVVIAQIFYYINSYKSFQWKQ